MVYQYDGWDEVCTEHACRGDSGPCWYCLNMCIECDNDHPEGESYCEYCGNCPDFEYIEYREDIMVKEDNKYKNIVAAVLNENCTTATISYVEQGEEDRKHYVFKVTSELAKTLVEGDMVALGAGKNSLAGCAWLTSIHEECEISPDSENSYDWIVSKIDCSPYHKELELEEENVRMLKKQRKQRLKAAFIEENNLNDVKLITTVN